MCILLLKKNILGMKCRTTCYPTHYCWGSLTDHVKDNNKYEGKYIVEA